MDVKRLDHTDSQLPRKAQYLQSSSYTVIHNGITAEAWSFSSTITTATEFHHSATTGSIFQFASSFMISFALPFTLSTFFHLPQLTISSLQGTQSIYTNKTS